MFEKNVQLALIHIFAGRFIKTMSSEFPIHEIIPELKRTLLAGNVIIVEAPPGAGKSTVLPLELLNESWLNGKKVLMLEPRRLAARSVATRMASSLGQKIGEKVGFRVRFENKISKATQLEVLTEGILTRRLQVDNTLENVGLIIFDEFHERSLHADLALALCREIQQVLREDLKIIIMSATLDGDSISKVLGNAPVIRSKGRQFPVALKYLSNSNDLPIPKQVVNGIQKALRDEDGDILAFLPGVWEIQKTKELLEEFDSKILITPLYGDLPLQKQQEAIMPDLSGRRKVVLATSIAETSLTIEGIKVVVDSGYSRVPKFNPGTGLTRLETVRVTKDTAEQRAGRAGRLGPGICYRLWNEYSYHNFVPCRIPEIQEADLAPAMLELAQWGTSDIYELNWITPPPSAAVANACEVLQMLKAIDEKGKITCKGKEMLKMPAHPRIAHMLLEGKESGTAHLACDIAALMEERDSLQKESGSNLCLRVEVLRKWRKKEFVNADKNILERIERLSAVWRDLLNQKVDNSILPEDQTGKLIAAAFPERVAMKIDKSNRFRLANGRLAKLEDHDHLESEAWLAVAHMDSGIKEGRIFMAAPLNPKDIEHLTVQTSYVAWDERVGQVVSKTDFRLGDIVIDTKYSYSVPELDRAGILFELIKKEGLSLFNLTEDANSLLDRISSLKIWRPEDNWPDLSEKVLLENLEDWFGPYIREIRKKEDFHKMDIKAVFMGMFSWEMSQKLDELAPEKIKVPSGSEIKLKYSSDGSKPVLAVRLQEMFGLLETPAVNNGKMTVLLHLLSPAYRPVQITQDLKSFWQNTYPGVRKELKIKYFKHSWPEDPWTAEAVRGIRKKGN